MSSILWAFKPESLETHRDHQLDTAGDNGNANFCQNTSPEAGSPAPMFIGFGATRAQHSGDMLHVKLILKL